MYIYKLEAVIQSLKKRTVVSWLLKWTDVQVLPSLSMAMLLLLVLSHFRNRTVPILNQTKDIKVETWQILQNKSKEIDEDLK